MERVKAILEGAVIEYDGGIGEAVRSMNKLLKEKLGEICGEVKVLLKLVDYDKNFIVVSAYCENTRYYIGFSARVRRVELELYDVRVR